MWFIILRPYLLVVPMKCEGFPGDADGKKSVCNVGDRAWPPTPEFLPGELHGQRSLVCYSPWGSKESDMTEWLHSHFHEMWGVYYLYFPSSSKILEIILVVTVVIL